MTYKCEHCGKKLPVLDVKGSATVLCRVCWKPNRIKVDELSKSAKVVAQ